MIEVVIGLPKKVRWLIAQRLGREALEELAGVAKPETLLAGILLRSLQNLRNFDPAEQEPICNKVNGDLVLIQQLDQALS